MKKHNIKYIQTRSDELFNNEYTLLGEYKGMNKKCETLHKKCGFIWDMNINNHLNDKKGCPNCYGNTKLTIYKVQKMSDDLFNNEYQIIDFISTRDISNILHKKCGNIFNTKISSHIYNKTGCPYCAGNKRLSIDYIKEKIDDEYVLLSDIYINNCTPLKFKHKQCQNIFETSISNFIKSKQRCPYCFKSISIGEKKINDFLDEKNINYQIHYNGFDCRDIKKLSFDFYLPDYNICIEYDGEQHFKPIEFFGGLEKFNKQGNHDNIKTLYCLKNNIKLIRISYFDDINEILRKFLVRHN